MRVLCIKDSGSICHTSNGLMKTPEDIKVYCGNYYNVINEEFGFNGERKYILAEKPKNCRYKKDSFAIPSDLNETELINKLIDNQLQSCGL